MMRPTHNPVRGRAALLGALAVVACTSRAVDPPIPSNPEGAITSFLDAVRAGSLSRMGEIWGSYRGPAVTYMQQSEMEQRLRVIRAYLLHDRYEILALDPGTEISGPRTYRVRLIRSGCPAVVPFVLVTFRRGWLVGNIDLQAVRNQAAICSQRGLIVTRFQDVRVGELPPATDTFGPGELPTFFVHGYAGETVQLRIVDIRTGTVVHDENRYIPQGTNMPFSVNVPVGAFRAELVISGVMQHSALFSVSR